MSGQAVASRQQARRPAWFQEAPDVELDVDRIPENESFFVHVMEAAERIRPGGVLAVRTDFEPSLLGAIMRGKDFESWSEERGPGEWRACFRRRRLP